MGAKKKKASGNAAAGEKVFKNLCGVCHSLSVSISSSSKYTSLFIISHQVFFDYSLTLWVLPLEVSPAKTSPLVKASPTLARFPQKLPSNGPTVTSTSG